MSSNNPHHETEDDAFLNADEADEIVERDEDQPMSDGEGEGEGEGEGQQDQGMALDSQEIILQNDSVAHFDKHTDSLRQAGNVEIPQEAFMAVLKLND